MEESKPLQGFPYATGPEIIRANQKDIHIEQLLKEKVSSFLESIRVPHKIVHGRASDIANSVHAVYLLLTTVAGSRTLGEEYCDLFYTTTDRSNNSLPSFSRRLGYVLTSSFGLILLKRWIGVLSVRLSRAVESAKLNSPALSAVRSLASNISIESLVTFNLALFYFFGNYYQISKRLWSLRYSFGHKINPLSSQNGYEVLGLLIALRFFAKVGLDVFNGRQTDQKDEQTEKLEKSEKSEESEESEETDVINIINLTNPSVMPFIPENSRLCSLCLEYMTTPATTLCGHLFCWNCVTEWCREKPECPLCRQTCLEQNLLPIS